LRADRVLFILLIFVSFVVSVNAPNIGVGYGFICFTVALAVFFLDPLWASLTVLIGELLGFPLVVLSRGMLVPVAVLGVVLRPIVAYVSAFVARRRGVLSGALALSTITPLVATLAGILYYGDDGIHSGLSVFNGVVVFLALAGYYAWARDRVAGVLSWLGSALFIMGLLFFPSPAALVGGIIAVLAFLASRFQLRGWAGLAGLFLLLLVGVAVGGPGLRANVAVEGYPFKPSSYGDGRWVLRHPCVGRVEAFEGVHDPGRLRIVHDCVEVHGIVAGTPFVADDGDYCFDLLVESSNASPLLSVGNIILRHGYLHAEIIPRDRGLLEGLGGMLCKGDEVVVRGVHVVDTDHGAWAEIHPVLSAKLLKRGEGPCVSLVSKP